MRQTEHTAIVLRYANYRDNDRMLTLFSPTRGRLEALARGCRRSRSPLLNASELFALGDYQLYEKNGHASVTSVSLIETFYPLRRDFDRLACGTYLLNLCEVTVQPGENHQQLFMLLLHTLSRLTFHPEQAWKPLMAGFLLHFAALEGYKPRLEHCVRSGRRLREDEPVFFSIAEGGLVSTEFAGDGCTPLAPAQARWMRQALNQPASSWENADDSFAPYTLLRAFVETRLEHPLRSASMLPE